MRKRRKALNGRRQRPSAQLRPVIEKARQRVINYAKRHGSVTSQRAQELLGTAQSYYHLRVLVEEGLLEHAGWNKWRPGKSR